MDSTPAPVEVVSEPSSATKRKYGKRMGRSFRTQPVDWEAARNSYFAGATLREVADAFGSDLGTVGRRASAEKWVQTVKIKIQQAQAERLATQDQHHVKSGDAALEIRANRVREHTENVHKLVEATMKRLLKQNEDGELPNLPAARDWSDVERVTKVARANLGLDAEGKSGPFQTLVNVNLLSVGDLPAIAISKS